MLKKLDSAKNHVYRNRGKYAALATLVVCAKLQMLSAKQWNEFLEEHNLTDAYYTHTQED